jgi:hypothetical protein
VVRKGKEALRRGERRVRVNSNASGVWADRVGEALIWCRPGTNHMHCIVRAPGERRRFGFPVRWIDEEEK